MASIILLFTAMLIHMPASAMAKKDDNASSDLASRNTANGVMMASAVEGIARQPEAAELIFRAVLVGTALIDSEFKIDDIPCPPEVFTRNDCSFLDKITALAFGDQDN
ncbi:hypothetical protein ACA910_002168 [Epithemia clementina (nom. ined.)]